MQLPAHRRTRGIVACVLLAAAGLPIARNPAAQTVPSAGPSEETPGLTAQQEFEHSQRVRAAQSTVNRIKARLELRPNDVMLQYYLAMYSAQADDREGALSTLRSVAERRVGLHPTRDDGFEPLRQDAEFQKILSDIEANEPKVLGAKEAFKLPDARFVPEGIAYDEKGQRFFIGSVAERRIVERTRDGKFVDFATEADGLKSVLGLRVDGARGLLYAVSNNAFAHGADEGLENTLLVFDLKTRKRIARYLAVEAYSFNDVAVSKSGDVVVTDSATGAVYQLNRELDELILLVRPDGIPSANGITFSPDDKRLFVAGSVGVFVVDIASGRVERLPQPDNVAAGALDGLYFYEGALIGVQNVVCPGRVVRLALDADATRITGLEVLQAYHPLLDEPTTGAIVAGTLYVIADSSISRLGEDRSLRDASTMRPTTVLKVPLHRT